LAHGTRYLFVHTSRTRPRIRTTCRAYMLDCICATGAGNLGRLAPKNSNSCSHTHTHTTPQPFHLLPCTLLALQLLARLAAEAAEDKRTRLQLDARSQRPCFSSRLLNPARRRRREKIFSRPLVVRSRRRPQRCAVVAHHLKLPPQAPHPLHRPHPPHHPLMPPPLPRAPTKVRAEQVLRSTQWPRCAPGGRRSSRERMPTSARRPRRPLSAAAAPPLV
jgi:hypothetical protein